MFRFEWTVLATDELLGEITAAAGVTAHGAVARIRPAVAAILEAVGGPPITSEVIAPADRTAIARRLLTDAVAHAGAEQAGSPTQRTGPYLVGPSRHAALASEASAMSAVALNGATAAELAALPAIGVALAERIVAERESAGSFASIDDCVTRVNGLGVKSGALLSTVLRVDGPLAFAGDRPAGEAIGAAIARLMPPATADPAADLQRTLHGVLASCASRPHPVVQELTFRDVAAAPPAPGPLGAEHDLDWCGVLWGEDYWQHLPILFHETKHTLDVCLFHMALGRDDHPTHMLIMELIAAKTRGVNVRVLLDRDRPTDPYNSTVINSKASKFLTANGVTCRHDSGARLLHSKFLICDQMTCVVGSHNWTQGSYFQMDDLSLVMHGASLGQELAQRFEALWAKAKA